MSDDNVNDPQEHTAQSQAEEMFRRTFLDGISIVFLGWVSLIVGAPVVGFLLGPLFKRIPQRWCPVGPISRFKVGDIVEVTYADLSALAWAGKTGKIAAWLHRKDEQQFVAFSVNCSHLGCPVRWVATAHLFMCPCHGGVYYENGKVAAGPPPRGLTQYPVRVNNGKVEILSSPAPIT